MALEVPVISTDVGGIPEVNIHGETGYLSKVGDVEEMAQNAVSILSSSEKHKQFRAQSLAKSHEFHVDIILPQYENLYKRALAKVSSESLIS